jgi:hypothetical protein
MIAVWRSKRIFIVPISVTRRIRSESTVHLIGGYRLADIIFFYSYSANIRDFNGFFGTCIRRCWYRRKFPVCIHIKTVNSNNQWHYSPDAQAAVSMVTQQKVVRMRSRRQACFLNWNFESAWFNNQSHLVRSRRNTGEKQGGETCCQQRISLILCRIFLHAVNLRHGTDGFTSARKEVCATDYFHRPRPGWTHIFTQFELKLDTFLLSNASGHPGNLRPQRFLIIWAVIDECCISLLLIKEVTNNHTTIFTSAFESVWLQNTTCSCWCWDCLLFGNLQLHNS